LERKDIDAVVVCTPPQWHALMSIDACQAGKDVFCEKPMSRFPAEARAMVQAAKNNKRVTQVGTQVHASENYHKCVDVVRSGILGQITAVRNFCSMNDDSEGLGQPARHGPARRPRLGHVAGSRAQGPVQHRPVPRRNAPVFCRLRGQLAAMNSARTSWICRSGRSTCRSQRA
jgi:predicted dehydrogenase